MEHTRSELAVASLVISIAIISILFIKQPQQQKDVFMVMFSYSTT